MAIAINGSSNTITGVAVGGLPDGIVDTDMLAAGAVTAAKASERVKGIEEFDEWRINSGFNFSSLTLVDSNWERNDTYFEKKGTGFSAPSSGVWTFPSTGKWLIRWQTNFESGSISWVGPLIYATNDNSSYISIACQFTSIRNTNNSFGGADCQVIFDVTDVSTHKIKLYVNGSGSNYCQADSAQQRTGVNFIRLGDT